MGFLSFFTSREDQNPPQAGSSLSSMVVDLGTFQVGSTWLGALPSVSDPFHTVLTKDEVFQPKGEGVEIGSEDGLFDYGFFTLAFFSGTFALNGQTLRIHEATSEDEIQQIFGEPYWIDRSDGEIILFYEYRAGTVELQFEFPDGKKLGFVTLSRNGVLADRRQRESYGVDKPWPPP
ncbi:MAG: hypothetical protein ABIS50_16540 [Luteolibacter sp.]|uniref:hypothetical protein n=1 Tax=Luteolibacter sp. TaxID=1962973 RepID=UPI0032638866